MPFGSGLRRVVCVPVYDCSEEGSRSFYVRKWAVVVFTWYVSAWGTRWRCPSQILVLVVSPFPGIPEEVLHQDNRATSALGAQILQEAGDALERPGASVDSDEKQQEEKGRREPGWREAGLEGRRTRCGRRKDPPRGCSEGLRRRWRGRMCC